MKKLFTPEECLKIMGEHCWGYTQCGVCKEKLLKCSCDKKFSAPEEQLKECRHCLIKFSLKWSQVKD